MGNAFLDALAHYRQLRELPALTINWSSWDEVGMAASMNGRDQQRWKEAGVSFIPPQQGVQVLGHLLKQACTQISVLSVDWSKFLQLFPDNFKSSFLMKIAEAIQSKTVEKSQAEFQKPKLLQILNDTPPNKRKNILIAHIQKEVAIVSGFEPSYLPEVQVGFLNWDSIL